MMEESASNIQPSPSSKPTATKSEQVSNRTQKANADVIFVEAEYNGDTWTFRVTVSHPDTGWEDYADGWDVVLPDGTVVTANPEDPFTRLLLHPHENEQPFTRSQSGLIIPKGTNQVTVRAHDLVDGFGGQEITLDLNTSSGEKYRIIRPEN
jgi:archaellum component FlaF (FlaF/FlaG flagellin family)